MESWHGEFHCVGSYSSVCELTAQEYLKNAYGERDILLLHILIYVKGGCFVMLRKLGLVAASALLLGLIILCQAGGAFLRKGFMEEEASGKVLSGADDRLVVIDPGHGGIDGGKAGANGVEEKEINLKISLKIEKMLKEKGIRVVMTRTADERLAENQVEDLKARVALMNEAEPVLVVSIHQNSYHDEGVSGAQVFYYTDSAESERAAGILQEALKEIDPENTKAAKGNRTYYILKKTEVPVVIAECGFLSNYQEAEKLADEEYQQELAEAITAGILQYINSN